MAQSPNIRMAASLLQRGLRRQPYLVICLTYMPQASASRRRDSTTAQSEYITQGNEGPSPFAGCDSVSNFQIDKRSLFRWHRLFGAHRTFVGVLRRIGSCWLEGLDLPHLNVNCAGWTGGGTQPATVQFAGSMPCVPNLRYRVHLHLYQKQLIANQFVAQRIKSRRSYNWYKNP